MNDKVVFGQYVNVNSWIHRLDPRTKILSLFALMIAIFFINSVYGLLISLGVILIIVLSSKIPITMFFKSFRMIAMLMIFSAAFQIIFNKNGYLLTIKGVELSQEFTLTWINLGIGIGILLFYFLSGKILRKFRILQFLIVVCLVMLAQVFVLYGPSIVTYKISLYSEGVNTALIVFLRLINLLSFSALLTFTTKSTDITSGIEGILAPFKFMKRGVSIVAMMIAIAIRFVPTLLNESQKILKAQAARGSDFNEGTFKDKVAQIVSLLVPMFVISFKKAEDLADAMEARAYIPGEDRTKIYELKYKFSDILVYVFVLLAIASIIVLKVLGLI